MKDKPIQETTSTSFNDILRRDASATPISELPPEAAEQFDKAIGQAFPDEAPEVRRRMRYIMPYIYRAIDWESYGIPLEGWQLKYYYRRERFLEKTGLTYSAFLNHEFLQEAIEQLGLEPEPTFEFILFLKYYFDLRSELRHSSVEQLQKLQDALAGNCEKASMDVVVDGRHFKFSDERFIKLLFSLVEPQSFAGGAFTNDFNEGAARDKIRALDYYLLKTLLDYLPSHIEKRRGQYTQAERNFALSVLNFTGRLTGDDTEMICGVDNNVTFDKLMRDFRGKPVPFAMELFL